MDTTGNCRLHEASWCRRCFRYCSDRVLYLLRGSTSISQRSWPSSHARACALSDLRPTYGDSLKSFATFVFPRADQAIDFLARSRPGLGRRSYVLAGLRWTLRLFVAMGCICAPLAISAYAAAILSRFFSGPSQQVAILGVQVATGLVGMLLFFQVAKKGQGTFVIAMNAEQLMICAGCWLAWPMLVVMY